MAIIGPRPLLVRYLARYNEEQHHRHDVRPGLRAFSVSRRYRCDCYCLFKRVDSVFGRLFLTLSAPKPT